MAEQEFDVAALEAAARGGNADAQYRMAALAISQQQAEQGVTWLRRAASNNHRDARFTLANFYLRGEMVNQDIPRAITLIEQLHRADYAAASQQLAGMLAGGFGMERDWSAALDILLESAVKERLGALRDLALLLILSDIEDDLAHQLLMAAATRSDIHAAMILTHRKINGDDRIDDNAVAFWVGGAVQLGYPLAGGYQEALGLDVVETPPTIADIPSIEASALKLQLLKPEGTNIPKHETMLDRPVVQVTAGAIASELCDFLIGYAAPNVQPAVWFNPQTTTWEADPLRLCLVRQFIPIDQTLSIAAISARMATIAGMPTTHAEIPNVHYYRPGDLYHPHLDVMPEEIAASEIEDKRGGQRVKSAVLYLNDSYEGGELHFIRADHNVASKKGSVVVYENTLADGTVDEQALHESKPVKSGEKWVVSLSLRAGEFNLLG